MHRTPSKRSAQSGTRLLIQPDEDPAVSILNPQGRSAIVLACDHASNAVPRALADLGLSNDALRGHIAWDEGAAEVTAGLSERLDARAVLCGYSRLVIDCNRDPSHETSIATESDNIIVPGNHEVSDAEREDRYRSVFSPYHDALAATLDAVVEDGRTPILIAIHSFTPVMEGFERPWHVTVLWAADPTVPVPLMDALRARGDLTVGDNVPYSGREQYGYTMDVHAAARGIPHALIEMRADEVSDARGIARFTDILADALGTVVDGLDLG